jgi:hypothetical protein
MAISANIFEKCLPALSTDLQRCGDPTLCDISPTTQDELASIYQDAQGRWRIVGALLETDFIGKACQVKVNGFYDFIRANTRELGVQKLQLSELKKGLWEVSPFVQMESKGPINNEYWTVANGDTTGGTFNGVAYNYSCEVVSQGGIEADVNWFPERLRVFIRGLTAGGSGTLSRWQVAGSEVIGKFTTRLYLNQQNNASSIPAAKKTPPIGAQNGVLMRGTPNVSDYESYCAEIPGLNTTRMTPFWIETTRYSMCDSDLWRQYIKLIRDNNPLYKKFQHVEDVDRNKQIVEDFQRRHANAFLYNAPLPNQTINLWNNLQQINVFSDDLYGNYVNHPLEGRCVGRRANSVGIWEQLNDCGRVKDLQGQVLNIPELQKLLYELIRVRQSNGIPLEDKGEGPVITAITDTFFAKQIAQAFYAYFALVGAGFVQYNIELSTKKNAGAFGFFYQRFSLDYPQCELRIATHPFFDDMVTAMKGANANLEPAGRFLWFVDWSTNYQGLVTSNTVTNTTGTAQELAAVNEQFLCVMKVPKESRQLRSMTYANVSECPAASIILENIASTVPEHRGASAGDTEPYDYYGASS